jgi:hypothetical protein
MERGIDRKTKNSETKIKQILREIERVASLIEALKGIAGQKIARADLPNYISQINKALADMKSFVQ